MLVPVCVNAKNEQKNILNLLDSLFAAKKYAEQRSQFRYLISVVLDDCTDNTKTLCESYQNSIQIIETNGGLVSAQRKFVTLHPEAKWYIFSDADIIIDENALLEISQAIVSPGIQVAYLEKQPLPNQKNSILSRALYYYNRNNGYQTKRHYFNGQFFAIKEWDIPHPDEIDFDRNFDNSFLNLKLGVRCDDIYLSRMLFVKFGKSAIKCADSNLHYRSPESFEGMFRKYQRMVLEIERLNHLFPKTLKAHKTLGVRKSSSKRAFEKGYRHLFYFYVFNFFLCLCRLRYRIDRIYHLALNKEYKTWKPVEETKAQILQS